jgi:hypothetical protein
LRGSPGRTRASTEVYRLTIELAGRPVAQRRVRVRWRYHPPRTIWDHQDDFQNVCVNQTDEFDDPYTIWKRNGRYYCVVSSWSRRNVTVSRSR